MNIQVILREDVAHVGSLGDLVSVKPGFARNFLLPRGLAVVASDRQKNRVEHEKKVLESRVAKLKKGADELKGRLDAVTLSISKAAGENEKLFGSVTAMEVEALLKEKGFDISRKQLVLGDHIKSLGTHEVPVKLHRDVTATIKVVVTAKA
jgi:large subunit ribosomal protein L9